MKTLRVTLADIIGPTGVTGESTATVHARYVDTSGRGRDVHLTDGTIVVPVRRVADPDVGPPEAFDFEVYANDAAPVREVDYGHLVEVAWTVTAPTGAKSSGVKRVPITDDMDQVVRLGLLAQPTPVPPYTGGYALAPDLAAEVVTRAAADAALDAALAGKAATSHTHTASQVSDSTTTGRALLTATDAAAARTTLALGTAATTAATAYATAVQGGKADSALQPTTVTGLLAGNGTTTTGRTITGTADEITVTNGNGASGNPTLSLALTAAKVGALPIPDPGAYYPTDTIDAALQLIGGRERYGTGSPEGVVTAPVGTYYTDTAITNGAMRWVKMSGSGNTGWKCPAYDSGLRRIDFADFAAPFNVAGSQAYLRRLGDAVHYSALLYTTSTLAAGNYPWNGAPYLWGLGASIYSVSGASPLWNSNNGAYLGTLTSSSVVVPATIPAGTPMRGQGVAVWAAPIPTTLPGTAA